MPRPPGSPPASQQYHRPPTKLQICPQDQQGKPRGQRSIHMVFSEGPSAVQGRVCLSVHTKSHWKWQLCECGKDSILYADCGYHCMFQKTDT